MSLSPEARLHRALTRVRQVLNDAPPGLRLDPTVLLLDLDLPSADPALEGPRLFACGWLHWLHGDPLTAEPLLARSLELSTSDPLGRAEIAYWLGRVRLLASHPGAVSQYEQVLRAVPGIPRPTCWFVDLLWRDGQGQRAAQVWKSLRGNRRILGCEEALLLEARYLHQQGDLAGAERSLNEVTFKNGVTQSEALLLRGWFTLARGQMKQAKETLDQALQMLYPTEALAAWQFLLNARLGTAGEGNLLDEGLFRPPLPGAVRALLQAQRARAEHPQVTNLAAAYESIQAPPLLPVVRYARACLGQDDFAALLASLPGPFLAARCRVWSSLERFCQREVDAGTLLTAIQQARAAGYEPPSLAHWEEVARCVNDRALTPDDLWQRGPRGVSFTANLQRLALERTSRLPVAEALPLLLRWATGEQGEPDKTLNEALGKQLLLLLLQRGGDGIPANADVCAQASRLLPESDLPALVATLLRGEAGSSLPLYQEHTAPLVRLWSAVEELAAAPTLSEPARWQSAVRELRQEEPALVPLAQTLLVYEAARRGAVETLVELLEDETPWRAFPVGPPPLVVGALRSIPVGALPSGRWPQVVAHWLQQWAMLPSAEGIQGLRSQLGLDPPRPRTASPPAGTPAIPWYLHQASLCLGRNQAHAAWLWVQRALAEEPDLASLGDQAAVVQGALEELRQQGEAQWLAQVVQLDPSHPVLPAMLLGDLCRWLRREPEGAALLDASTDDVTAARQQLEALALRTDLPAELAHPLGILYLRAALAFEEEGRFSPAEGCWRLAWNNWLRWLQLAPVLEPPHLLLLDHLLSHHRRQLNDWLARNEVDRARRLWDFLFQLRAGLPADREALRQVLGERLEAFRSELTTSYLLTTRELMAHGEIPEGWRSDYEKGLACLRRLLSLDRDNLRLLVTLVEICSDWFLDLYNSQQNERLTEQVDRFTPFALQLARRIETVPGDLAARAAVAEFYKFRGFVAESYERKRSLYQEALRFNPANDNVRALLQDLEKHLK